VRCTNCVGSCASCWGACLLSLGPVALPPMNAAKDIGSDFFDGRGVGVDVGLLGAEVAVPKFEFGPVGFETSFFRSI
jgi:hypothetical protein